MEPTNGSGNGTQQQALAVREQAALDAYTPRSYEQAMAMAGTLGKAAGIAPEIAFLKMAAGAALGIDPVAALQAIDVIDGPNGRMPAYRARLMVALCLRAKGICEYFEGVESDATHATWRAKRFGRPERVVTYGMEDAQRAKLVKPGGAYEKDPESQFNARASARLARLEFPDVTLNMYTREELEDTTRDVMPTVSPLPGAPSAAPIVDGEIVEPVSDEERIVKALGAATSADDVKALATEALKLWPKERPAAVKAAHADVKKRIATAGLVAAGREPGDE